MKFSFRDLKLTAYQALRIHEVASFFMLVSDSGDERINISIDDDPFSECPVGYEYREGEGKFYEHITVKNPNAGQVVIEYIMSTGLVRSSPTITAMESILAQLRGDVTPEDYNQATIGVAQSEVLAENTDRKSFSIQAKSTNTGIVYVGFDNLVTSTKWFAELQPGQSCDGDDYRGPLYVIGSAPLQRAGYAEV